MDHDKHTNLFAVFAKIFTSWMAVLGAVTLQQWGAIVGIVAGILASAYTALQFYILWRDKVANYRPSKRTRSSDFAELGSAETKDQK